MDIFFGTICKIQSEEILLTFPLMPVVFFGNIIYYLKNSTQMFSQGTHIFVKIKINTAGIFSL